jgi:hypothetical protein
VKGLKGGSPGCKTASVGGCGAQRGTICTDYRQSRQYDSSSGQGYAGAGAGMQDTGQQSYEPSASWIYGMGCEMSFNERVTC